MRAKIYKKTVLDKYIIVVDGDEKKVVYDLDDSRIFSVHITGCGRGARNAGLTKKTFFRSKEKAEEGIKYLDTCHWNTEFKAIKVSELESISKKGFGYLMEDIEWYNRDIDFEKEVFEENRQKDLVEQQKLKNRAVELINSNWIESIDESEYRIKIYI